VKMLKKGNTKGGRRRNNPPIHKKKKRRRDEEEVGRPDRVKSETTTGGTKKTPQESRKFFGSPKETKGNAKKLGGQESRVKRKTRPLIGGRKVYDLRF